MKNNINIIQMPKTRQNRKKNPSKSRSKSRKYYGVTGGDVRSKGDVRFNYSGITGGDVRSKNDARFNYSGITSQEKERLKIKRIKEIQLQERQANEVDERIEELKKNGAYFENGLLYNKDGKRIDALGRII